MLCNCAEGLYFSSFQMIIYAKIFLKIGRLGTGLASGTIMLVYKSSDFVSNNISQAYTPVTQVSYYILLVNLTMTFLLFHHIMTLIHH